MRLELLGNAGRVVWSGKRHPLQIVPVWELSHIGREGFVNYGSVSACDLENGSHLARVASFFAQQTLPESVAGEQEDGVTNPSSPHSVSYTHLRAHETRHDLV